MSATNSAILSSARLRYLHEAARLLATSAPATYTLLEMQYDKLVYDYDLVVTEPRSHEICGGACDNLTMDGSNLLKDSCPHVKLLKESCTLQSVVGDRDGPVNTCGLCYGKILQAIEADFKTFNSSPLQCDPSCIDLSNSVGATGSIGTAASTSTSKKRAKARKQGELLAVMARSRSGVSMGASRGFDVIDFHAELSGGTPAIRI